MSEKQECDIAQNRTTEVFETKTSEFNVCGIRQRLRACGGGFHKSVKYREAVFCNLPFRCRVGLS